MKIRNGFVSNSSSSSFVVQIKKTLFDSIKEDNGTYTNIIANEESISILKEYGFSYSLTRSPFDEPQVEANEDLMCYMYYSVTCNQDEVIEFLVKNNIPFKASCHYGHCFVMFKKDDDQILEAYNFGMEIDTYGFSDRSYDWEMICKHPKVIKRYVGNWVEGKENED
jgi:hypothetical protein